MSRTIPIGTRWGAIAHQLDSAQAWNLPGSDQIQSLLEQRGISVSDDIGIRIERRCGAGYEIGWYYSPKSYDGLSGQQLRSFVALLENARNWR